MVEGGCRPAVGEEGEGAAVEVGLEIVLPLLHLHCSDVTGFSHESFVTICKPWLYGTWTLQQREALCAYKKVPACCV